MTDVLLPAGHPAAGLTDDPVGAIAVDFLHRVCNERTVVAAFDTYVGEQYSQHNPMVPDGRDGGIAFLSEVVESSPELAYAPVRIATNGDIAMLHAKVTGLSVPGWENGVAVVDIFRVVDGKIVEHWDVVQPLPDDAANDNSMF